MSAQAGRHHSETTTREHRDVARQAASGRSVSVQRDNDRSRGIATNEPGTEVFSVRRQQADWFDRQCAESGWWLVEPRNRPTREPPSGEARNAEPQERHAGCSDHCQEPMATSGRCGRGGHVPGYATVPGCGISLDIGGVLAQVARLAWPPLAGEKAKQTAPVRMLSRSTVAFPRDAHRLQKESTSWQWDSWVVKSE